MELVRRLFFVASSHNFTVVLQHIPGTDNAIADVLSRMQMTRFWSLAPLAAPTPTPIDVTLTRNLLMLQRMSIADSTQRTYSAAVKKYRQFCNLYNIDPLPASETTLRYFCIYAYRTISHRSISVYLAAIRQYHLEHGFSHPLAHTPLLHYVRRGIQRHQGDKSRVRLPITVPMLRRLKRMLRHSCRAHRQDRTMLWAALTLTFYGFLRGGEVTSPTATSFSKYHHLCRRDLTISPACLL